MHCGWYIVYFCKTIPESKELLPDIFMSKEMFLLSIFFIFVNNARF